MKKYLPLIIIAPVLILVDLWTKYLIVIKMAWGTKMVVWQNYFDIVHITNKGAAFGMMSNLPEFWRQTFFTVIAIIAFVLLLRLYQQSKILNTRLAICFILGGALGNIIDRTYRGAVVDFLSFHWQNKIAQFEFFGTQYHIPLTWPAFNAADIFISAGVLLLMISMLKEEKLKKTESQKPL